jgi:hypothetical protein
LLASAIACCATAALALPPKAEAAIHLGSTNTTNLTQGLVGYWPLDGATTNWNTNSFRDVSGNGHTASSTTLSTTTSTTGGKIGQAINFVGGQDIRLGAVGGYSNRVTVSAWVYHRDLSCSIRIH